MNDVKNKEIAIGVVKGAFGAIPYAGQFLNEVVFDIRGRIKQQRFNDLVEEISVKIKKLESGEISESLIKSEEFGDLFEKIVREATNRKMHKNLKLLARISVECMKSTEFLNHPLLSVIVESVSSLTESELSILNQLIPYNKANQQKIKNAEKEIDFQLDYSKETVLGLKKNLFLASFDSLISKGLVFDDTVGRWGGGSRLFIKPSQLGIEIFNLLEKIED